MDPDGTLIQHRLYREHCIGTDDNVYIKDLRIFEGRDLKDIIIVDNAVYSFGSQLSNGIPILPFKYDKEDMEFIDLMAYLESIYDMPDYRVLNESAFQLQRVFQFDLSSYVEHYKYDEEDNSDNDEEIEQFTADTSIQGAQQNPNSKSMKLPKSVHENLNAFQIGRAHV